MDEENQGSFFFEDGIHALDDPYCGNAACWCHTDVSYHEVVTTQSVYHGFEVEAAYGFFGLAHG